MRKLLLPLFFLLYLLPLTAQTDHSVARQWNEQYLEAIRNDFARPVVHARNLYHSAAAMYDAWALVRGAAEGNTALMGTVQADYLLEIDRSTIPNYADKRRAADRAISYAAYRLLLHRYRIAPGINGIRARADSLMTELGYDPLLVSTDYAVDTSGAALGNHIAAQVIAFGANDGANEALDYENVAYPEARNNPLDLTQPLTILGTRNPSAWQPLAFGGVVIDQSGNVLSGNIPGFLGASWGRVHPFALKEEDRTDPTFELPIRGTNPVYHDPGPPPLYNPRDTMELDLYRWNFELVLKWSSHLDPRDSVMWDIGPGARGNATTDFPTDLEDHRSWYNEREGGQQGNGHELNPVTGEPYPPNVVPRGDYTRVLAEFWADGPDSETPPGHWFTILNGVMDHPLFERKYRGQGEELVATEYDVKAYLILGGAMHDAAITAWSIKGAYDYVRPITAIRYLSVLGQASDTTANFYNPLAIRLDSGFIEPFTRPDQIVNSSQLARVRARAWLGNAFINDPDNDQAGVNWMNPSLWEPYQRPTFVTPNFAGYVSGHSTFSSAAATVLESLTGSPYFPGGVGEFVAKKNEFLVFEQGPSEDVVLQWATYRDASNETSLSRIWGGIHPPADDIPGRIIGLEVGADAFALADAIFLDGPTSNEDIEPLAKVSIFPNPVRQAQPIRIVVEETGYQLGEVVVLDILGREVARTQGRANIAEITTAGLKPGTYFVRSLDGRLVRKFLIL